MASDLKLDTAGDLAVETGDFVLISDSDETVQSVRIRLRFYLGEWFLDNRLGVPFYEQVFVKNPDLTQVEGLLRGVILETPGMATLTSYRQTLDGETRTLTVTWAGTTDDGTLVENTEVIGL